MYLDKKRVFLAGATGMVGSSIIRDILTHHPETRIRAVFYQHTKPFIHHQQVDYVYGELKTIADCRRLARGCDCAIMAAATTGGAKTLTAQAGKQLNDNVIMNAQLLEAFRAEKIRRVAYIGSATLYQEFTGSIKEEQLDWEKDPHPAYAGIGWAVRCIEKLCKFWQQQSKMEIIIVRAANIFGPFAKFNPETSNFIPAVIRKAVDKMDPFEVWGSPEVIRDVIYSEDFARAIVAMINNEKIKFNVFNIGSGVKTTVADVVRLALKYAEHKPAEIRYLDNGPTTINFRALDCTKARATLNWKPQYTIDQGIKKTTEWWIENKGWWKK